MSRHFGSPAARMGHCADPDRSTAHMLDPNLFNLVSSDQRMDVWPAFIGVVFMFSWQFCEFPDCRG